MTIPATSSFRMLCDYQVIIWKYKLNKRLVQTYVKWHSQTKHTLEKYIVGHLIWVTERVVYGNG